MDSLDSADAVVLAPAIPTQRHPRIWKFWGTAFWGLFVFAAMFVGQIAVVAWFVLRRDGPFDFAGAIHVVGGGLTISLSVIAGLPAVIAALWIATRLSGTPFPDYLALRGTSWKNFLIGGVALGILVMGWDLLSRATGREVEPGFMGEVLKSARADNSLWLLVLGFCVAAPLTEVLDVLVEHLEASLTIGTPAALQIVETRSDLRPTPRAEVVPSAFAVVVGAEARWRGRRRTVEVAHAYSSFRPCVTRSRERVVLNRSKRMMRSQSRINSCPEPK